MSYAVEEGDELSSRLVRVWGPYRRLVAGGAPPSWDPFRDESVVGWVSVSPVCREIECAPMMSGSGRQSLFSLGGFSLDGAWAQQTALKEGCRSAA